MNPPSTPTTGRQSNGTFAPGHSMGRKPGSKNKNTVARETLKSVQGLNGIAVAQLKEKILQGDMSAIKLVLSYCLPTGGRLIELDSPNPNAIIDAATNGDISPDEAARLAQAFKTAGDAADLQDLKKSVEELELLISSMRK